MEIIINEKKFNLDIADTFFKRLIGLMGKKNIQKGLFFPKTGSIHTFFMKEKIDVIMLDKKKNVIYYQKSVPHNKIIIQKKAYYTIELPENSLQDIKKINKIEIIY